MTFKNKQHSQETIEKMMASRALREAIISSDIKDALIHKYQDGYGLRTLEKEYGISSHRIKKLLIENNIKLFTQKEINTITNQRNQVGKKRDKVSYAHSMLENKEWLYEQYITKYRPIEHIANDINCSHTLVRKYIKDFGFDRETQKQLVLEEYKNSKQQMHILADKYNISVPTISRWAQERDVETRNPNEYERSFKRQSQAEIEISQLLNDHNVSHTTGNRALLEGMEIDIVVEDYKFGIEYNGLFYHNEDGGKGQFYHVNKTNKMEEKGYSLFHVYEDSWINKKDVVKSMILNKVNKTPNIVYARKCIIKNVSTQERIKFLNDNHLQGSDRASFAYGLYYDSELISVISFKKSRYNKNYDWELVRYATKIYHSCVGGFSKLLKHFMKNHEGSIISYSDRNHSTGNLYQKNGFKQLRINGPSYTYFNGKSNKRFHRSFFTRKTMIKMIGCDDKRLTERDLAKQLGLKRVWECGTAVWVIEK